jgi:MFS family permease
MNVSRAETLGGSVSNNKFGLKRFVVSRFLSSLSDQFLLFVIPLVIFKSTGSVKYSGLAFIVEWLPRIIFFPVVGFFVDRIRPRRLFFGIEMGRAGLLLLALSLIASGVSIFVVLAITAAFLSIAYVANFVGTEALLPRNLAVTDLPKANSMLQGVEQITQVLGPALAAVLSVWGGQNLILALASVLFAISGLLFLSLKTAFSQSQHTFSLAAVGESNRVALRVLLDNKILLQLSALTWVVNLVYGAALVVSASVIIKGFSLPDRYFAILQGAAALASVVTFAIIPRAIEKCGISVLGSLSFCAMIISGLTLSLSRNYALYLIAYSALMAFDGAFSVYIRTIRSQIIPKDHLGKTTGLIGLLNMCSVPLSAAAVMQLSDRFTPFGIFGVIFVIAATLGFALVYFGRSAFGYPTWLPSIQRGSKAG